MRQDRRPARADKPRRKRRREIDEKGPSRRLHVIAIAVIGVLGIMALRAGWIATVEAGELSQKAKDQHESTIKLPAPRGPIMSSDGRELAVALGLTPGQHSSGGKEKLLGISKRGDKYVRTLLIHGARSALRTAPGRTDRISRWAVALAERSHANVAVTALANKTARVAWAMLRHGTNYEPERMVA